MEDHQPLKIGELARRSGVAEGTLRAWERRHGFPVASRLPSGHRRFTEGDVELVRAVEAERAGGLGLAAAIARVAGREPDRRRSAFAQLHAHHPGLARVELSKRTLIAFSRAIEDEIASRPGHGLVLGAMQRERFYRRVEARWRDLARGAEQVVTLADFGRARRASPGPAEIPLPDPDPLKQEWILLGWAQEYRICLVARERLGQRAKAEGNRRFDAIWSVEPAAVLEVAELALGRLAVTDTALATRVTHLLHETPASDTEAQLRLLSAVTARVVAAGDRALASA